MQSNKDTFNGCKMIKVTQRNDKKWQTIQKYQNEEIFTIDMTRVLKYPDGPLLYHFDGLKHQIWSLN